MERYTKWRDAGTGVAPFLPVSPPETTTLQLPLRMISFIVKVPLILVAGIVFLFVDSFLRFSLGSFSIPAFERCRSWSARLVLLTFGFFRIPVSNDNRKTAVVKAGDVLVVNQSSPVDILILVYLYPSALFTRCDNEMLFETQSALAAFFSRFTFDRVRKGCALRDLTAKQSSVRDRLIVVFPECTTSNNRGLLAFCPIMLDGAYVTSIKYNNPAYLSTPLPRTYWTFIWALASLCVHGCRVKSSSQKLYDGHADALSRFGRIPKTNLGIDDKSSFLAAWSRR